MLHLLDFVLLYGPDVTLSLVLPLRSYALHLRSKVTLTDEMVKVRYLRPNVTENVSDVTIEVRYMRPSMA